MDRVETISKTLERVTYLYKLYVDNDDMSITHAALCDHSWPSLQQDSHLRENKQQHGETFLYRVSLDFLFDVLLSKGECCMKT